MGRLSGLRWKPTYASLIAVAAILALAAAFVWYRAGDISRSQIEQDLTKLAQRSAQQPFLIQAWTSDGPDDESLASALELIEALTGADVSAYGSNGELIARSATGLPALEEQPRGPEISAALNRGIGLGRRRNASGDVTYFVAAPVTDGGELLGALELAYPASPSDALVARLGIWVIATLALAAGAIILILLLQARRTKRKLQSLTDMVARITQGDLDARVLTLQTGEIEQLASALNRMADRLQKQTRKRRREKDRLNTVLRTMNDGIVILNRRGEVKAMNPAAARILSASLRRSHRRSFVQVARDYRIAAVWNQCQKTGVEQSASIDLANERSVHVVITPFLKRRARGYLVMIQDLTQLKRLQTVRQDFVSNVSHELRTPLASLRALVETLRDGALDDPPAAARFLDRMEVEVDVLTQMVQELLELSRIESGQVPLQRKAVSPAEVVEPAVERLRPQAERAGLDLILEVDPELPEVLADTDRIQQVVTNLVHNATKFTPSEGQVTVRVRRKDQMVVVTVHDTGIGIPSEELERVFERFYKAEQSRAFGGTGLGLSIASHLVQAHGGEIWASSVEEEWSEFGFSLPIADAVTTETGTGHPSDDDSGEPAIETAAASSP